MTIKQKHWTRLGLSAAMVGTAMAAGCGPEQEAREPSETREPAEQNAADYSELPGEAGEGEGGYGEGGGEGEGGEGEGGINIAAAGSDPVVFRSGLAIAAAHVIAARDAYAEGKARAAAEMFAHPVSEVLYDMQPHLQAQGVAEFNQAFLEASTAALNEAPARQVTDQAEAILDHLSAVSDMAPESDMRQSRIAAGVVADQIDRAVDMYRGALASGRYAPYLDGYGFYRAAAWQYERNRLAIAGEEDRALTEAIEAALDVLSDAYPGAAPQAALDADISALAVANSNVQLALD